MKVPEPVIEKRQCVTLAVAAAVLWLSKVGDRRRRRFRDELRIIDLNKLAWLSSFPYFGRPGGDSDGSGARDEGLRA